MYEPDREKKLLAYHRSCRKGVDWLQDLMNDDGAIGLPEDRLCYYRVPWTFALTGELPAASRVLDWIERHMFTPEGVFEGVSPQGIFAERFSCYPLACLIVGAAMMQRFDLVYCGTPRLLTWQDPESGGFYNSGQNITPTGDQLLFPTCQGGMTLLLAGQVDAATMAGQWLDRLWELQPDSEHKLYAVYRPAEGLVTSCPPDEQPMYVTMKNEPWQNHFNGGIAAAFLTELHLATGEPRWLELARHYQRFSMTTDECQFQSMQTCKSGWGSGLLYVATRDKEYLDWTLRLGDWFVQNQFDDGHWENTKFWVPNPTHADKIEITAEFVMHLANITKYVAV